MHHAYLFTGTRGVGKTTIARILAKAINCETGITAKPCDECSACTGISEGRFIDLIEVDAASRTKVEDTRALLENVHYQSTYGRFKVYLIDEVHMLSGHSFNALLKTLEEPPEHVKFLLATTDPQKLPVTVLSRCIQFNLRALQIQEISDHLSMILKHESIPYEDAALAEISRQARGSMRDGLSLLDQAISYGAGNVTEESVRTMLGMISRDHHATLVRALVDESADAVMQAVEKISERGASFEKVLDELLLIFHQVALARVSQSLAREANPDIEAMVQLAGPLSDEDIQLYYQIGLIGKRDLPLAPDPRSGFEMVMLRMLAFKPQSLDNTPQRPPRQSAPPRPEAPVHEPGQQSLLKAETANRDESAKTASAVEPVAVAVPDSEQAWQDFVETQMAECHFQAHTLARQLAFDSCDSGALRLTLDSSASSVSKNSAAKHIEELERVLSARCGKTITIEMIQADNEHESPARREKREHEEAQRERQNRLQEAKHRILSEPVPQYLIREFQAAIDEKSIKIAST